MKRIILLTLSLLLTGCSLFTGSKPETTVVPPPKVTHNTIVKPKKIERDLGSLWSDDSYWNQMYSPTQSRVAGDIVTIKIDKKFMSRLELALKRPEPEEDEKKDKKKDDKDAKAALDAAQAAAPGRQPASVAPSLPSTLEVTIVEALPRGMYKVAANHGFKPALDSPYVYIEGVLREREIAADDTVSSDALLDLKFESINHDMRTENRGEKK